MIARWRPGGGALLTCGAAAAFLFIWLPVLAGRRSLVDVDLLYQLLPWGSLPGAHPHFNPNLSDVVLQVLPWQRQIAAAYAAGEVPLWNPSVLNGVPFLAQDQPAPFSPFTLFALLFEPARGLSLAMLLKLWVAGIGTGLFLRALGAGGLASALGGIAYASSSYMVIWLGWPQTSVAAIFPWAFAASEWFLRSGNRLALPALAIAIALQFFGGHPETSVHFGLGLAAYVLIRALSLGRGAAPALLLLVIAGLVGTALAGAQLLPFLEQLRLAGVSQQRASAGMGFVHLDAGSLTTWLAPNAAGNPAVDGRVGALPNYNEGTGFATITALVLAPVGVFSRWRTDRSVSVALGGITLISLLVIYGPLTPFTGRLPILDSIDNARLIAVVDFTVPVLAGLGFDALLKSATRSMALTPLAWIGLGSTLAVVLLALIFVLERGDVDRLTPDRHGYIVFWLALAAVTLLGALSLTVALASPRRPLAAGSLACLLLLEAVLFVAPWNPRANISPPRSGAMNWLASNAGDHPVAALSTIAMPESAGLYGVSDVRGYEVLIDSRKLLFWSSADPAFDNSAYFTLLNRPDPRWLARAGVAYVITPAGQPLAGTTVVDTEEGVSIDQVPNARPFAFAAQSASAVSGPEQAAEQLKASPDGPVLVEGKCCATGSASVAVVRRTSTRVELDVQAGAPATIVIEQSYNGGWQAAVDGHATPVQPADIDFQAVQVPAGRHRLVLSYQPKSFSQGLGVSLLGLAGLLVLLVSALSAAWTSRAGRSG